jgi:phosphoribosylanthranilate isomerase
MSGFQRIQLNLKFGSIKDKYDPEKIADRVKENPQWQFILQYSDATKNILPRFKDIKNHAVLFDESAGRGISPDTWSKPIDGHFCGYAGGLNPDNVQSNLDIISQVAKDQKTWIDMETGVRTDNQIDLLKIRHVLSIAQAYVL